MLTRPYIATGLLIFNTLVCGGSHAGDASSVCPWGEWFDSYYEECVSCTRCSFFNRLETRPCGEHDAVCGDCMDGYNDDAYLGSNKQPDLVQYCSPDRPDPAPASNPPDKYLNNQGPEVDQPPALGASRDSAQPVELSLTAYVLISVALLVLAVAVVVLISRHIRTKRENQDDRRQQRAYPEALPHSSENRNIYLGRQRSVDVTTDGIQEEGFLDRGIQEEGFLDGVHQEEEFLDGGLHEEVSQETTLFVAQEGQHIPLATAYRNSARAGTLASILEDEQVPLPATRTEVALSSISEEELNPLSGSLDDEQALYTVLLDAQIPD